MNPHTFLNSFINFEQQLQHASNRDFQLDRMHAFLQRLDNPHQKIKTVQVAGSKGKGSTSIFIAEILRHAGYRVGLYTSPHLHAVNERIRILSSTGKCHPGKSEEFIRDPGEIPHQVRDDSWCDGAISDEALNNVIDQHRDVIESMRQTDEFGRLTYYEVLTAMMFCYFVNQKIDVAVLETGLGGRLDATNVAHSMVGVLTSISLEHMNILGDTLGKIALEKVAIVKDIDQKLICAPQENEAMKAIQAYCREKNIDIEDVLEVSVKQMALGGQVFTVKGESFAMNMVGEHQAINAATAIKTAECLRIHGFHITVDHIKRALHEAKWPGRFEVIDGQFILDGAHNAASISLLGQTIKRIAPTKRIITLFGTLADKNIKPMLARVHQFSHDIILVKVNHNRGYVVDGALDVDDVITRLKTTLTDNDVVVITGSLFLVAEAREVLLKLAAKS